ncbi:hypothetical protein GDO81_030033, partial [Engystomops pustulosus]
VFGAPHTVTSRCDLRDNLINKGCSVDFIEGPRSKVTVVQSFPLSSKGSGASQSDIIQMTPQSIALSLRPVQVRQVEDYPVDLYYLMDLSLSMKDDLDTIRNLGTRLAAEMAKLTSNFRLGFGSFVDKNVSPFSYTAPKYQNNPCTGYKPFPNCIPSFGFRHVLSLTDKVSNFNTEVQNQQVSRNRDAPEGAFDAILQAAVCKDRIGWRTEASHLLVITTDDVPHIALDGKLAGLVQPHDGQCHLNTDNEYSAASQLDYPSLALLGEKLAENNIHLIFAVTKAHYLLYKNFTALIPGTTVEILDPSSQNILQLIVNAYNNIRSKVELTVSETPDVPQPRLLSHLSGWSLLPRVKKCGETEIGDTPVGFGTPLRFGVRYDCSCRCSQQVEVGSVRCSSNGTYSCGMCRCDPVSWVLAVSHGDCDCGECKCDAGYIGENCNCTTETESCMSSDGRMCSGRGTCVCGRCQCIEPGAFGETCEKCPTCPDACGTKRDCIECRLYQSGRLADNHTCHRLCHDHILTVEALDTDNPEAVLCVYKTENECVMRFTYTEDPSGKSILTALKEPECGGAPDALTVLLAVVGSILLVGFILLVVWKLLVTIHDRREFARFQSERSRAKYEMAANPLYRQPISTHNVDEMYSMMAKSYNGASNGFRAADDID